MRVSPSFPSLRDGGRPGGRAAQSTAWAYCSSGGPVVVAVLTGEVAAVAPLVLSWVPAVAAGVSLPQRRRGGTCRG